LNCGPSPNGLVVTAMLHSPRDTSSGIGRGAISIATLPAGSSTDPP
jgi:hypothetical protein